MTRRRNDIEVEDVTGTSQYGGLQVLKDAHSLPGHYIRTKESLTVVQPHFDTFSVTYDGNNNPSEICYSAGTSPHLTTIGVLEDNNSSLSGTYFIISTALKEARYAIYYVVDGVGTAPSLDGVINLRVEIQQNDPSQIVATATDIVLRTVFQGFRIRRANSVLEIETVGLGITHDTIDVGTGFLISNTPGTEEIVQKVLLEYSASGNPIWQSQELVGYEYNVYTGRFELANADIDLGDIISTDCEIINYDIALKDIEESITIPDGTKKFILQTTNKKAILQISYVSGESNTNYLTLKKGATLSENDLNLIGKTIYVRSDQDATRVELLAWT